MSRRFVAPAAAIYVVVSNGCTDPSEEATKDTWVDGEIAPTSDSGDNGDGDGESGADTEEEQIFALWLVEGSVVPGTSFAGAGELVALDESETERCILVWDVVAATPVTDCAACEFAFELTLGPVEVDFEHEPGACEGWVELALEGSRESLGYAEGGIFRFDGTAWPRVGDGEFVEATGAFSGEYELEAEE